MGTGFIIPPPRIRVEHYMRGGIETLDYIKAKLTPEQYEGYLLGNVHKYLGRWQDKNGIDDLHKAQTYLGWLIEHGKLQEDKACWPIEFLIQKKK